MRERPSVIVVAASLVLAWPAAAEKPEAPVPEQASQSVEQRAPTVLASADGMKLPEPVKAVEGQPAPKKVRAARVTTCRCGDAEPR